MENVFFWEGILFYYTEMHKIEVPQLFTKAKQLYWHRHLKCYEIMKMKMSFKTSWRPKPVNNTDYFGRIFYCIWQSPFRTNTTCPLNTGQNWRCNLKCLSLPCLKCHFSMSTEAKIQQHTWTGATKKLPLCFPESFRKICFLTARCLKQPKIG